MPELAEPKMACRYGSLLKKYYSRAGGLGPELAKPKICRERGGFRWIHPDPHVQFEWPSVKTRIEIRPIEWS